MILFSYNMPQQLIILIAPPGAGKGTQAELLAQKFGLFHLETAKVIDKKFAEAKLGDKEMDEQKRRRSSGELMTPEIIYHWLMDEIRQLARQGTSLILSGSPRTLFEAEKEAPEFNKLFGKENIKIFNINLSQTESVKRNSARRMCQANRHPIPNLSQFIGLTTCPQDGSAIITRDDDRRDIIVERYRVYKQETEPVLDFFKKSGYIINEINGEQSIEKVFSDICGFFHD